MTDISTLSGEAFWLPIIFIGLMGLAFFVYAILDGYDLGVGILLPNDSEDVSLPSPDGAFDQEGELEDADPV